MILADINDTPYKIVLFLHVLTMFVAFAPAFVHPFIENDSRELGSARQRIFQGISQRGMRIYGAALIVGGLLGFGVAGMSGVPGSDELVYRVSDGWVLTSVILWVAMNGALHAMVIPGERKLAEGDESQASRVQLGGMVITGLFLITLYLMVFKPGA